MLATLSSGSLDAYVEHRNPAAGSDGVMTLGIDWPMLTIRSSGRGFWSSGQVADFFSDYRLMIQMIRRRTPHIRVISDMREAPPQSIDVAEQVRHMALPLYVPGDRIAMVVPNTLAKMQMRRVLDPDYHRLFVSAEAAEMWLQSL